jgi:acetyl esterase/lipase
MSLRLAALSFWLRLIEKPSLARMRDEHTLRRRFEQIAKRIFVMPKGIEAKAEMLGGVHAMRYGSGHAASILYLHGGAFLAGSHVTHGHLAAWLAQAAEMPAYLIDYRLAPEHPFPSAVEDACSAYASLAARGPVVLAGDSAGGGLVFSVLVVSRQARLPDPLACVAFSPWADMTLRAESLTRNARADCMLPVGRMREVATRYLDGASPTDLRASPVLAAFRPAPPPAFISYAADEILADDALAMADALRRDGGRVELECNEAAPHAWPIFARRIPEAGATLVAAGQFIKRAVQAANTGGACHDRPHTPD